MLTPSVVSSLSPSAKSLTDAFLVRKADRVAVVKREVASFLL
jgi:hypothetical protein